MLAAKYVGAERQANRRRSLVLARNEAHDQSFGFGYLVLSDAAPDVAIQLQPGDADMDCDFDQLDLVQVQVAAKYLTGEAATWGEGDWNGAPGGSAADKVPPPGNGLFDQLDIIAALSAGKYLQGSYCGEGGLAAQAVPEPSTFLLLALGLAGTLFGWRRRT